MFDTRYVLAIKKCIIDMAGVCNILKKFINSWIYQKRFLQKFFEKLMHYELNFRQKSVYFNCLVKKI